MFTAFTFVLFAAGTAGCGYCIDQYIATGKDNAVLFALCMVVMVLSFGELFCAYVEKVGEEVGGE